MASETAHLLRLYGGAAARVARRGRKKATAGSRDATERPVFVVGAPRSGTTFMAGSLGELPGFVDLGEVGPLKASIHDLAALPEEEAARRLRQTLERVRALGLARRLRAIEQTPETSFVVGAAVRAYPQARVVHMVRDARDVVCSLLAKGWLSGGVAGADDVGAPYGGYARFWVEPERVADFQAAGDARRAAWAWRRYLTAARAGAPGSTLEVHYEELAADPRAVAEALAAHIGADRELLARALADVHAESVGRWRRELTEEQLTEVEAEAGPLLRELAYD
ncbi:MAG TPA: sulfotransferase [Gaiellaceae bacterium]|nr:sulfotransferase [Gaiellaceae bacterium]